jgi:hypothetical protein
MVRIIVCLMLCLEACTSHIVRCDAHLQPINAPAEKVTNKPAAAVKAAP